LASKTSPASATVGAAPELASAPAADLVSYRVLPKGAGLIYTGDYDALSGTPVTFEKGDVVDGVDPAIAGELEDRGLAEVLVAV
jgi:hypothetical protein